MQCTNTSAALRPAPIAWLAAALTLTAASPAGAQAVPGRPVPGRTVAPIELPAAFGPAAAAAQSVWGLDRPCAGPTAPSFAIGDGRVVAAFGSDAAVDSTVHAPGTTMLAPDNTGTLSVRLTLDGRPLPLPHQRLRRLRGTDLVATEDAGPALRLQSVAMTDGGALWQLLAVRNDGDAALPAVRLELRLRDAAGSWSVHGQELELGALAAGGSAVAAAALLPRGSAAPVALLAEVRRRLAERLAAAGNRCALTLDSDDPRLPDFVCDATVALLAQHEPGVGPRESGRFAPALATGPLLAFLRTGLLEPARDILRSGHQLVARGEADGEAACWIVLHHYWYLRTTHDAGPIRAHWPVLAACLPAAADHGASFAAAALRLHATQALGGLLDGCHRIDHPEAWDRGAPAPRPGAEWTTRALRMLAALEADWWCEAAGQFAPAAPAEERLLPPWMGMLLATGDRATRHATGALHAFAGAPAGSGFCASLRLVACTQFDARDRDAALDALLLQAGPDATWARPDGTCDLLPTGAAVDACLFAWSGLRLATGPGVDEDWLRLRPSLPRGVRRSHLRGLAAAGRRFDLHLEQTADDRLRVAVTLRSAPHDGADLVVVNCAGMQLQGHLRAGETLQHDFVSDGPPAVRPPPARR